MSDSLNNSTNRKSIMTESADRSHDSAPSGGQISQSRGAEMGGGFDDFYFCERGGVQGYADPRPPPPVQLPRWEQFRGPQPYNANRRWEYGQNVQPGGTYMQHSNIPPRFVTPVKIPGQSSSLSTIMDSLNNDQKKYIEIYKLN